MKVCVVGRGKVGRALAGALRGAGVACSLRRGSSARPARIDADVVVLAVPDAAIRSVAARLAGVLGPRTVVLHTAGARDLDDLTPLRENGIAAGVCHPLVSFASPTRPPALRDVSFTCFGDARAMATARKLARTLGARAVVVPHPPGPAYHAAAALLANGAAALAHAAARLLGELGFGSADAERALAALLASVADNIRDLGVPAALTGPVARGDAETVARHLTAVASRDPAIAAIYAALQPAIVATARARGLDAQKARAILDVTGARARTPPIRQLNR